MKYNLLDCLTMEIDEFDLPKIENPDGILYYQDNGCNVLGVAHLDYVMKRKPRKWGQYVMAPQLDDRLGAWILLNRLPAMGIKLDILLTDKEESCNTTAQYFYPDKKYNWVIEFDRAGDDIVFYQYDGFADYWPIREGAGSYSDIAELEHLGVMCANIGIGYYCQHTDSCYADLAITRNQVKKFAKFYYKNKDTRLEYEPPRYEDNEHEAYWQLPDNPRDMGGENYFDQWENELDYGYSRECAEREMENLYWLSRERADKLDEFNNSRLYRVRN